MVCFSCINFDDHHTVKVGQELDHGWTWKKCGKVGDRKCIDLAIGYWNDTISFDNLDFATPYHNVLSVHVAKIQKHAASACCKETVEVKAA